MDVWIGSNFGPIDPKWDKYYFLKMSSGFKRYGQINKVI